MFDFRNSKIKLTLKLFEVQEFKISILFERRFLIRKEKKQLIGFLAEIFFCKSVNECKATKK